MLQWKRESTANSLLFVSPLVISQIDEKLANRLTSQLGEALEIFVVVVRPFFHDNRLIYARRCSSGLTNLTAFALHQLK